MNDQQNTLLVVVERLAELSAKLDAYLHRTATNEDRIHALDERVRVLEQGHSKIFAIGAVGTVVAGGALTLLDKVL